MNSNTHSEHITNNEINAPHRITLWSKVQHKSSSTRYATNLTAPLFPQVSVTPTLCFLTTIKTGLANTTRVRPSTRGRCRCSRGPTSALQEGAFTTLDALIIASMELDHPFGSSLRILRLLKRKNPRPKLMGLAIHGSNGGECPLLCLFFSGSLPSG